jgi:AbrB family looped-hinge helix DNA binding protein
MKIVSVTRKGQVKIPEEVRKKLGIREGSKLLIESVDKERLVMAKANLIKSWNDLIRYSRKLAKEKHLTPAIIEKEVQKVRKEIWNEKYAKRYGR